MAYREGGTTKVKQAKHKGVNFMASKCRHIMPSGKQCRGYALQGEDLCYFHSRRHIASQKPKSSMDSIEIPLLVLRAVVNNTIDRHRASLLLYGLQLSLQTVDRSNWAIPLGTVENLCQTSDGQDLAADPDDEDQEEEDEDDEEDSNGADSKTESEADIGEDGEHNDDEEVSDSSESSGHRCGGDFWEDDCEDDEIEEVNHDSKEENIDDILDNMATEDLITSAKYLEIASNALEIGDTGLAARLLKKSGAEPILRLTLTQRQAPL
jgi:hypothetical protein